MLTTARVISGFSLLGLLVGGTCSCGGGGTAPSRSTGPAQGRVYRVGIASYAPDPGADRLLEGLFASLETLGFARGSNLEVEHVMAAGEMANVPLMLQNLDGEGMDLIITLTTPVLASACQVVRHAPVVFCYVTDPIAAGAGTTFADHLPNVTGVGSFDPVEETFDILALLRPNLGSVGTLYNASEANSTKVVGVAREIAKRRGVTLEEVTISGTSDVLLAAQSLTLRDVDALWVPTDNTAAQAFSAIGLTARKARLPLLANEKEQIAAGALIAVGASWRQVGEVTARMAARVLRGELPKDIPFENFVGATVLLNHDLAREIGIEFPPEIAALDGKNAPRPAAR
jgi:putative tryptophan/tyrosine transport system substrate-binding protein